MNPLKAFTLSLGELDTPVVTRYQLGLIAYKLYKYKEYGGEHIGLHKDLAEIQDLNKYLKKLLDEGVLNTQRQLPKSVYTLLGRSNWNVEDAVCTIDPFCYISHLSAMSYHGLTDRIPSKLFISSPAQADWKKYAYERMKKDLKDDYIDYIQNGLPLLSKTAMKRIGKIEIHRFNSKHVGAFKLVRDRPVRVATLGRAFLDMLRNPELCGGINHVLDVFDEYAPKYLKIIISEFDQNGSPIDKVRAGYIIEERLKIQDDIVESWTKYAQRGGSRKLDSSSEYESTWSDKWCISVNIFERI
jgi:predicted transcriptional regulator of viral defense system